MRSKPRFRSRKTTCAILILCIIIIMSMGCGEKKVLPSPYGMIAPSEVLYEQLDKLSAETEENTTEATESDTTYHLVLDSRIGAKNENGYGFRDTKCVTYREVLSACSKATLGSDIIGYVSCEEEITPNKEDAEPITVYWKKMNDFFRSAERGRYNAGQTDLVGLMNSVADEAIDRGSDSDVYIVISDLMMSSVDDAHNVSDALAKITSSHKNLSIGLVGIECDYYGGIKNVPLSSIGIDMRYIPQTLKNEDNVFRRPLYLLMLGAKDRVLSTMDAFLQECERSSALSEPGQVQALYYFDLETQSRWQEIRSEAIRQNETPSLITLRFGGEVAENGATGQEPGNIKMGQLGYDTGYVFLGLKKMEIKEDKEKKEDKNAYVYQSADREVVQNEYREALTDMPFVKMYAGVLGKQTSTSTIRISCPLPYEIVRTPKVPNIRSEIFKEQVSFNFEDNSPYVDVTVQQLLTGVGGLACGDNEEQEKSVDTWRNIEMWDDSYARLLKAASPSIDLANKEVTLDYVLDNKQLELDVPTILSVTVEFGYLPDIDMVRQLYNIDWLNDWTIDMPQYTREWKSSPRRIPEGLKTAYLADVFGKSLLDQQIQSNLDWLQEEAEEYAKTVVFGFVLREQVPYYSAAEWEDDMDFGWAYSRNDVAGFLAQ